MAECFLSVPKWCRVVSGRLAFAQMSRHQAIVVRHRATPLPQGCAQSNHVCQAYNQLVQVLKTAHRTLFQIQAVFRNVTTGIVLVGAEVDKLGIQVVLATKTMV